MAETPPGPAAGGAPGAADPSMEDILASIRRILNEDDAPAADAAPAEVAATPAAATAIVPPPPAARPDPMAEPLLALTEDMIVETPVRAAPPPEPFAPPKPFAAAPDPAPPPLAAEALLAPAAAAAAVASVGTLLRAVAAERAAVVHRGGPTIEDVVREELRPLLKEWLDRHLPPMVERLVQAEIERVVGRAVR